MAAKLTLTEFMTKLAMDVSESKKFVRNPKKHMSDAGLTKGQQKVILSQDVKKLNVALLNEQKGRDFLATWITCYLAGRTAKT